MILARKLRTFMLFGALQFSGSDSLFSGKPRPNTATIHLQKEIPLHVLRLYPWPSRVVLLVFEKSHSEVAMLGGVVLVSECRGG